MRTRLAALGPRTPDTTEPACASRGAPLRRACGWLTPGPSPGAKADPVRRRLGDEPLGGLRAVRSPRLSGGLAPEAPQAHRGDDVASDGSVDGGGRAGARGGWRGRDRVSEG